MDKKLLKISGLESRVEEEEILNGINLEVNKGELHVIMGPNGAGKSTLANVLMGHPEHQITKGEIEFEGEKINDLAVDKRAKKGIFLSFQYPQEIPGVTVENFLRTAKTATTGEQQSIFDFKFLLEEKMDLLNIDQSYADRYLNKGFSGGEKKKNEILQMAVLEPKLAILDETDSGLDVDATKTVAEGIKKLASADNAMIIITHHNQILDYLKPDFVHVLVDGKIAKSGDMSLAEKIEKEGYAEYKEQILNESNC
ncbi:Fe-S cluster assembly ATPase SufC [Halanaerobium praevalens]|uniref:Iron-regulated ABC transporter ATPase subunit SufC n=1 Tax=Halanaerobium praevalens (strain ATCC 33744 / DSM 2228 / GSL) TaxID=572479 RepID=E3DQK9_HALPG|nr:Fe-S cluster assembly ATPase SufC [Halanaerobium praevalens]ADO77920.1 Iron-regulated ABC transporter ATPase subunit SufC [Halanaerobium praevalens DSM 2228]